MTIGHIFQFLRAKKFGDQARKKLSTGNQQQGVAGESGVHEQVIHRFSSLGSPQVNRHYSVP
jgi:hypothetical protein